MRSKIIITIVIVLKVFENLNLEKVHASPKNESVRFEMLLMPIGLQGTKGGVPTHVINTTTPPPPAALNITLIISSFPFYTWSINNPATFILKS